MQPSSPLSGFDFDKPNDVWLDRIRMALASSSGEEPCTDETGEAIAHHRAGERIGPYETIRQIGSGGMGTVWLARRADGHYDQTVAIKLIKRGMDTEEIVKRFRLERQVHASLNHPNIARMLDGGATEDGSPYLVMEYVEGASLLDYCEENRLDVEARLELFQNICLAVHHAHTNLVLHRDLKPSNILVTADGNPMLLDFGIAKLLNDEQVATRLTQTDARALTPLYASPEQIQGARLTTVTDVYSLGVLLYEMLSGRTPYRLERGTHREIERTILEQQPAAPSAAVRSRDDLSPVENVRLSKRLRGDLDTITLKALSKETRDRYASAEQLAEDVKRHINGMALLARRPTSATRLFRLIRRRRGALFAAGIGAVLSLAVATAVVVYWFLVPGWIDGHVQTAHRWLVGGHANQPFYNTAFYRTRPFEPGHVNSSGVSTDSLAPALDKYEAAMWLGASDAALEFEYQTVRLAHAIATQDPLQQEIIAGLADALPLTAEFAREWKGDHLERFYSAEELDRGDQADLRCLGLLAFLRGGSDTAIDAWVRLRFTSADPLVETVLGSIYLALNQPELAYPRLLSAHRSLPKDADLAIYLADAAARCGDVEQAKFLLADVADTKTADDSNAADRVHMLCMLQTGRTTEALDFFLGSDLQQNNAIAGVQLANHLEREGDLRAALDVLAAREDHLRRAYAVRQKFRNLMEAWWAGLSEVEKTRLSRTRGEASPPGILSLAQLLHLYAETIAPTDRFEYAHPISARARWTQLADPVPHDELTKARAEILSLVE